MFGKKKDEISANENEDNMAAPPLKPFSRKGSHAASKPPSAATYQPEVPRRVPEIAGVSPRRMERPMGGDGDGKRLVVGRDIRLSGEITACDKLVVEGHVEVSLPGARVIEVSQSGYFKGTVDVEEADISGRFEGELIARDRLVVRAGGRISGTIRYGRIVIESGGEISGDMQTLDGSEPGREDVDTSSNDEPAA